MGPQLFAVTHQSLGEFEKTGAYIRSNFTPLTDIHLHSNRIGELESNGNILYVYIFSAIALFILTIACVQFYEFVHGPVDDQPRKGSRYPEGDGFG